MIFHYIFYFYISIVLILYRVSNHPILPLQAPIFRLEKRLITIPPLCVTNEKKYCENNSSMDRIISYFITSSGDSSGKSLNL